MDADLERHEAQAVLGLFGEPCGVPDCTICAYESIGRGSSEVGTVQLPQKQVALFRGVSGGRSFVSWYPGHHRELEATEHMDRGEIREPDSSHEASVADGDHGSTHARVASVLRYLGKGRQRITNLLGRARRSA